MKKIIDIINVTKCHRHRMNEVIIGPLTSTFFPFQLEIFKLGRFFSIENTIHVNVKTSLITITQSVIWYKAPNERLCGMKGI